jgi:hypothetical protein
MDTAFLIKQLDRMEESGSQKAEAGSQKSGVVRAGL